MSPTEFQAFRKGQTITDFIHAAIDAGYIEADFHLSGKAFMRDDGSLGNLRMDFRFENEDFVNKFVPGRATAISLDSVSADELRTFFDSIVHNMNE